VHNIFIIKQISHIFGYICCIKLKTRMMKMNFLKNLRLLAMLFVVGGLVAINSCKEEEEPEPEPTETIMQIIDNTAGFDSLKKYLAVYPDLVGLLGSAGTFTVFAPDNSAFIALLATPGFPADIRSINPLIVKGVLAYHVSATRFDKKDLISGVSITTSQGEAITINANGTLLTGSTNQAIAISEPNIKATNGVIHKLGSVLIPPTVGATLTPILGTNAGSLLLGAPFSNLATVITKGNTFATANSLPTLTSILAGSARHTVFAPTNATFAAAAGGAANVAAFITGLTAQQCYGIVANHVVLNAAGEQTSAGDVTPEKLTTGATFATAAGAQLLIFNNTAAIPARNGIGVYIDSNGDVVLTDPTTFATGFNAEVALPNAALNSNGRVHVIAGLLVPPVPGSVD